jgi:hypothetical protein
VGVFAVELGDVDRRRRARRMRQDLAHHAREAGEADLFARLVAGLGQGFGAGFRLGLGSAAGLGLGELDLLGLRGLGQARLLQTVGLGLLELRLLDFRLLNLLGFGGPGEFDAVGGGGLGGGEFLGVRALGGGLGRGGPLRGGVGRLGLLDRVRRPRRGGCLRLRLGWRRGFGLGELRRRRREPDQRRDRLREPGTDHPGFRQGRDHQGGELRQGERLGRGRRGPGRRRG